MGRAHAANAILRVRGVRGLARWLTRPAYRRLLDAEPYLRRAVPLLIVAFIAAVAIGAVVQIADHRREAIGDAQRDLELFSGLVADELSRRIADDLARRVAGGAAPERVRAALQDSLPARAAARDRRYLVADANGRVIAVAPAIERPALERLGDLFDPSEPPVGRAEVTEIAFLDGARGLAMIRVLPAPLGQLAAVQPLDRALDRWRADSALTVTLVTTTSLVLLILGFAFHWQAARAREADDIYETVRTRLDIALNRGRCGVWDWDLARGRVYWSDSMFAILGRSSREELLSFGEVDALVHPDDGSLYEIAGQLAETPDGTIDRAFRMRHANGEWVWLRARAELVHEPAGGTHIIGTTVDITEERKLAERTATADMRLRDSIETISESFVLWDVNDRLVLCNSKFRQLHDLPPQAVEPGTPYECVAAAGRRRVNLTPLRTEERPEEGARTFEAQTSDGMWLKISERRTKDGGFVSVGTDITAIKRNEAKLVESEKQQIATIADLRQTRQALEVQAQQLAELAQKHAEEAERAEDASRAKSEFLASMSHELRTPLNAIIGFSEIMQAGMFGELGAEKYHEYCRDIQDSGRYLLDVINDILDMSKIEAGRLRLDLEDVRIDAIVAEAMRVMSLKAEEKRIEVVSEVSPGLTVRADRRALKQIFLNLLSNSIKFTSERGRVAVRARRSHGCALLLIDDSGIGISKAALKRLGRPFEQVESRFTKTQSGSGLGLAIAKSLAELHGGRMKIRSIENVGTTVIVRLPLGGPALVRHDAAA